MTHTANIFARLVHSKHDCITSLARDWCGFNPDYLILPRDVRTYAN
jgi:hypothetical protein